MSTRVTGHDYIALRDELRAMPLWKHVAAALTTAEKTHPIVAVLALPESRRSFEACITFARAFVEHGRGDKAEGEGLVHAIEAAPEWGCEYPNCLPFAVLRPFDLAKYAVNEAILTSGTSKYDGGFSHMLDITGELDGSDQLGISDAEERSQVSIVDTLRDFDAPCPELFSALELERISVRNLIAEQLPTHCSRFAAALLAHD